MHVYTRVCAFQYFSALLCGCNCSILFTLQHCYVCFYVYVYVRTHMSYLNIRMIHVCVQISSRIHMNTRAHDTYLHQYTAPGQHFHMRALLVRHNLFTTQTMQGPGLAKLHPPIDDEESITMRSNLVMSSGITINFFIAP